MPRVSIVVPTHNRAHHLPACIDSILGQTFTDFELLIADDGSTDDTAEVIASYADSRIQYLRQESNKGAGDARNRGLAAATGEWIAFNDSDDTWTPEKLADQIALADASPVEIGAVYSLLHRIEGDLEYVLPWPDAPGREGDLSSSILLWNFLPIQTAMVRADVVAEAGGFDVTIPRGQDWEFWIRVAQVTRFAVVEEVQGRSEVGADSITRNDAVYAESTLRILDKHADLYAAHPAAHAAVTRKLGGYYALRGDRRLALRMLCRSLRRRPLHPATWAFLGGAAIGPKAFRGIQRLYRSSKRRYSKAPRG